MIRWPGSIDDVEDAEAKEILTALREDAKRGGTWVEFDEHRRRVWQETRRHKVTSGVGYRLLAAIFVFGVIRLLWLLVSALAEALL